MNRVNLESKMFAVERFSPIAEPKNAAIFVNRRIVNIDQDQY